MIDIIPTIKKDDFIYRLYPSLSKEPKAMVVVLHGYNSNIDYMHATCVGIRNKLKHAAVIAPQAPIELKQKNKDGFTTYSWININDVGSIVKNYVSYAVKHRLAVTDKLINFIDRRKEDLGIEDCSKIGLNGHSLGAIIGFIVASKAKLGSFVSMASVAPACIDLDDIAKERTPVHYIMGEQDELFISNKFVDAKYKLLEHFKKSLGLDRETTVERFKKSGIIFSETLLPNTGHDLSEQMINTGINFLYEDLQVEQMEQKTPLQKLMGLFKK